MPNTSILPTAFAPRDLQSVMALLRTCLPLEPITVESFTRRVLLDPNFDPTGALVLRGTEGDAIGFVLAMAIDGNKSRPSSEGGRGWITLFAVSPGARRQGLGSRLFEAAESYLAGRGCTSVWIAPYGPGYWIPGVDEAAYPEAVSWLPRRGYAVVTRPLAMEVALGADWSAPAKAAAAFARLSRQGIDLLAFAPEHTLPILEFLRKEFTGDWVTTARETMRDILAGHRSCNSIWSAMRGGECIAFAQFDGERFGPIGVADGERGRGIGTSVMYAVLSAMQQARLPRAYFLWTTDATAAQLYIPAGFREVRRFQVVKKELRWK